MSSTVEMLVSDSLIIISTHLYRVLLISIVLTKNLVDKVKNCLPTLNRCQPGKKSPTFQSPLNNGQQRVPPRPPDFPSLAQLADTPENYPDTVVRQNPANWCNGSGKFPDSHRSLCLLIWKFWQCSADPVSTRYVSIADPRIRARKSLQHWLANTDDIWLHPSRWSCLTWEQP